MDTLPITYKMYILGWVMLPASVAGQQPVHIYPCISKFFSNLQMAQPPHISLF